MKADILIKEVSVVENGSSRKSCPGLLLVKWMPPGEIVAARPGGRTLELRDKAVVRYAGYQEQLELRAAVTGKSWLEVQLVAMNDFGLLGKLALELVGLAKNVWPLPIGSSLLDAIGNDLKSGAPQTIAFGKSPVREPDDLFGPITIAMQAPSDVLGDLSTPTDPITGMPTDGPAVRPVLLSRGSDNGHVVLDIVPGGV